MVEKTVLAVDPGSAKCGVALVSRETDGHLQQLWRGIVPPAELVSAMDEARAVREFSLVIVGSGTGNRPVVSAIREAHPGLALLVVDERETSLQARERYWEHHRRRGWRRLLPASLQSPPEPYDDFVAFILAERVLAEP